MDKEQRKQMGIEGNRRVKRLYNFDHNMEEYVEAIQHAIKK